MHDNLFLWPHARLQNKFNLLKSVSTNCVEKRLSELFGKQGFPVLVSSARAGLVMSLEELGVQRVDLVKLFPYASHCVIEAVGRVGTPAVDSINFNYSIIYHQWGYVQDQTIKGNFIEDGADSFCLPGVKLFPLGGKFEIWSLPKLLGSLGGGVVWCRDEGSRSRLISIRDKRNESTNLRWALRLLSNRYPGLLPMWYGAESVGGPPPRWGCSDILENLERWNIIASARKDRLMLMQHLLPTWLKISESRLPAVIPAEVTEIQYREILKLGFNTGFRHFERIEKNKSRSLYRLFPIPLHQDVPLSLLVKVLKIIRE